MVTPWETLRRGSQSVYTRMHTGGAPDAHRSTTGKSVVHPVYLRVYFRCTQREGPENRAVQSEMNPKSAGLPKVYADP